MDALTFIRHSLTQAQQRFLATLHGIDDDTLAWRPAPHANAIIEIVWHVARADDRLGRTRTGLAAEVWTRQQWAGRFGLDANASANVEYQFLRGNGLAPKLETTIAYLTAIHTDTLELLGRVSSDDLERVPDPARPQWTIATCFRHMITHKNNHHGQIDFVRGLRQPGWDLPPGTAAAQS